MSTDHIRYDLLAQDALRGVVRRVLAEAAREGLPGEHHFFISFKTRHPGVKLSPRLTEQYPEEITIVLQHQFWDLIVSDQGFEVGLSFQGHVEKLIVAFEAVTGFFDPSVQFALKFEILTDEEEASEEEARTALPVEARGEPAPKATPAQEEEATAATDKRDDTVAEEAGEKVVSLDTFRKKK